MKNLIAKICGIAATIILLIYSCFTLASTPTNWYDNLVFKNPTLVFEMIRVLGQTAYGGADIGEVLQTATAMKPNDIYSWYQQWLNTANRIYKIAETAQKNGHTASSREAYFRASSYYRAAGFFMDAKKDQAKSIIMWKMSRESFLKAIASLPYIKFIQIPYEHTTLDGYLIKSPKTNAPLLIIHTGFDGTMEELYFNIAIAARERGFNVLLFEGPGQGGALRTKNLYFRPDWENVLTPVIDFVEKLPNINTKKIALLGISMGGYLAPRACSSEHRITACIADEGLYDFSASVYQKLPTEVTKYIATQPKTFNQILFGIMQKNLFIAWFFNHGMWALDAKTPTDFMQKIREYSLEGITKNIKCPTLIIGREADDNLKSDSKKLYDLIQAPKTYYEFTSAQAAQAHVQAGAQMISNQVILDWLCKIFDWKN